MCDDLEKRYRQYAATMQDAGITPHSFTARKRVQKSAPPFALVVEVRTNSGRKPLEQQVIDASYRAYQKWVALGFISSMGRSRRPATFEQWLGGMNLACGGNVVRIVYRVHDEIITETVTGSIAKEIRNAFERNAPTCMLLDKPSQIDVRLRGFGESSAKCAREADAHRRLNIRVQVSAADDDKRKAIERHKQE